MAEGYPVFATDGDADEAKLDGRGYVHDETQDVVQFKLFQTPEDEKNDD